MIGGRRGIGAAVVRALLARGDAVTYTYRTDPGDLAALQAAHPDTPITTVPLDLADRAAVDGFADGLEDRAGLGRAGPGRRHHLRRAGGDDGPGRRRAAMQVNYFAFARIARAVVRPMLRARSGRIVAVGSVIGQNASQGNAAYGASKAALLAYVRTLAIESARRGVTVNYVAPGFVDTDMMAPFAAYRAATEARIPAGRFAAPGEIAAVVGFLATPEAELCHRRVYPGRWRPDRRRRPAARLTPETEFRCAPCSFSPTGKSPCSRSRRPPPPGPGEVQIGMRASGSTISTYGAFAAWPSPSAHMPLAVGAEAAGEVVADRAGGRRHWGPATGWCRSPL